MIETSLLSVLMTVYNREKYIAEAIESVLASTYTNFELIIVDDCSTDNSVEIAKSYEAKDSRIKVYVNEQNLGQFQNRNKAASYAKGKYIKYLDSDDIIYPHGLEVMVNAMERFPEAAYALSFGKVHDKKPYPFLLNSRDAYKEHFLKTGLFNEGPTSLIFNTQIFKKENGFQIFKVYGDSEILLRLSAKYPMVKMQPALTWWRQHSGQEFDIGNKNDEYFDGVFKLNIKFLEDENCPFNEYEKAKALKRLKQHHARKILRLIFQNETYKAKIYYKMSGLKLKELLSGIKSYE
ncbi:MAG: glycosyltransferase [Bacteroidales bacterium]|nr:glycosyltransferase [Bacteroidales bacterium]